MGGGVKPLGRPEPKKTARGGLFFGDVQKSGSAQRVIDTKTEAEANAEAVGSSSTAEENAGADRRLCKAAPAVRKGVIHTAQNVGVKSKYCCRRTATCGKDANQAQTAAIVRLKRARRERGGMAQIRNVTGQSDDAAGIEKTHQRQAHTYTVRISGIDVALVLATKHEETDFFSGTGGGNGGEGSKDRQTQECFIHPVTVMGFMKKVRQP